MLEGDSKPNHGDLTLLKAVARVRRRAEELVLGKVLSVSDLARREGIDGRSVRRFISLGLLAPRIIEASEEGHQPAEVTLEAVTRRMELPLLWSAQHQTLSVRYFRDVDSRLGARSTTREILCTICTRLTGL